MRSERLKRINKICNILDRAGFKKLAAGYRNFGTPEGEDMESFMPTWTPPPKSGQGAKPFSDLESRDDKKNYSSIVAGHERVLDEIEENTPANRVVVEKLKYLIQLQFPASVGNLTQQLLAWKESKLKELEEEGNVNRAKDSRASKRR
jgi:hypothetical protein